MLWHRRNRQLRRRSGRRLSTSQLWACYLAALATAAVNILADRLDHPASRTAARQGAAIAALGVARAAGVSWAELGLGRGELASGLRTGMVAGGCAAVATLTGAALPA